MFDAMIEANMLITGIQEVLAVKTIETNIVQENPSDKILLILHVNCITRSKNVVAVVLIEEVEFCIARPACGIIIKSFRFYIQHLRTSFRPCKEQCAQTK
jgi:hypothetical protein